MAQERKYALTKAKEIPHKQPSKYRPILEDFVKNKDKVSYIQFDDIEELILVYAGLTGLAYRHDMNIKVRRKSDLMRIYLEKL